MPYSNVSTGTTTIPPPNPTSEPKKPATTEIANNVNTYSSGDMFQGQERSAIPGARASRPLLGGQDGRAPGLFHNRYAQSFPVSAKNQPACTGNLRSPTASIIQVQPLKSISRPINRPITQSALLGKCL